MQRHKTLSLEQLHQQQSPVRNPNQEFHKRANWGARLALFITQRVGSIQFFLLIVAWTVL